VSTEHSTGIVTGIHQYINTRPATFVRRVVVILLLLYFAVMVDVGRHVYGTVEEGFFFTYLGYEIFPLPYTWGVLLPVIVELDPLRSFIYFTFIGQGMWALWVLIGIVYIVMPLLHWVYNIRREQEPKSGPVQSDMSESIGILTGLVSVISVYLSVVTYTRNVMNYGLLPLIVVSTLSIVVIGFVVDDMLNVDRKTTRRIPVNMRSGSVVLLILGLMVLVASGTPVQGPNPVSQLGMFGTGLLMVVIALVTIRIGGHRE
jgi:hypothetical protein